MTPLEVFQILWLFIAALTVGGATEDAQLADSK